MNTSADQYFLTGCGRCPLGGTSDCKVHTWSEELAYLRQLILATGLLEDCKWGVPCYTYQGGNVLLLSAFTKYCSISFFKGILLQDEQQLLVKPGPHSHAGRLFKFTNLSSIQAIEKEISAYIYEAMAIEKAGLTVPPPSNTTPVPKELEAHFAKDPALQAAFEALTPGRQRGYLIHFTQPKQEKTRISRIEKCIPMILSGIGLHDKYGQLGK